MNKIKKTIFSLLFLGVFSITTYGMEQPTKHLEEGEIKGGIVIALLLSHRCNTIDEYLEKYNKNKTPKYHMTKEMFYKKLEKAAKEILGTPSNNVKKH